MRTPIWGLPGDIFFAHGEGVLAALIRWAETDPGEVNGTWANHMGVVVEEGWLIPPEELDMPLAVVVEALNVVEKVPWWKRHFKEYQDGYRIRVFRHIPSPTLEQEIIFNRVADEFVGDKYGWWKLGFHLLDRLIFKGKKVLSSLLFLDRRPICSYASGLIAASIGWSFGLKPEALDPDEAMDYCLLHRDEWSEILGD